MEKMLEFFSTVLLHHLHITVQKSSSEVTTTTEPELTLHW